MKNIRWVKFVERESDFWRNYMMISAVGNIKKVFDCTIKERLITRRGMIFIHWLNPKAVWSCSLQIEKKIRENPKFINKISAEFNKSRKALLDISNYLKGLNFKKINSKKLFKVYNQFCETYKALYPPFHLVGYIDSIESKAKEWLLSKLKETKEEKKFDDYFIKLSAWPKLSPLQKEELSLIKIALKVKKERLQKGATDKLIISHTKKYAGLPVVHDKAGPWNEPHFYKHLTELLIKSINELIKDYNSLSHYRAQIKNDQISLFKKLSTPLLIQKFFRLIGLSAWIRLASRNAFAISHYSSKNLFNEIGRRNNLTGGDVKWFNQEETKKLILRGKMINSKSLADREFAAVLLFRNGKYVIFEGKKADRFIKTAVEQTPLSLKSNFIKGSVAYTGVVRGPAKLILSQKDIAKMKKGDILVARMTTMEIVPAVRMAAAIVTDEGGIMCHAAIVARELQIPCVVGTKIVTKVLKDGDLVEVDANRGIVKKL